MTAKIATWLSSTLLGFAIASTPAAGAPAKKPGKPAIAKATGLSARLYDIRGFKLEMPMEEFRKGTNPDWPNAKVVCDGDSGGGDLSELHVPEDEKRRGIRKCVWLNSDSNYRGVVGLALGPMGTMRYEFKFVRDPKDGVEKLYSYFATVKAFAFGEILQLLTEKYGQPKISTGSVQNGLGARFDSREAMWANPLSILHVKERWLSIDQMAIMMTSNRLLKVAEPDEPAKNAI